MSRLSVIFDLDGTLVKFKLRIREARREFIEYLESLGIETWGLVDSLPTNEIIRNVTRGREGLYREVMRALDEIFSRYEMEAAMESEPREGATALLEMLEREGVGIAVATNNSRAAALASLRRAGMMQLRDLLVSRDDSSMMKPDPEMLIRSARLIGAPLNSCIHVGDSHIDVLAARGAGMLSVAIAGGVSQLEKLIESRPHIIVKELYELSDLITRLWRNG